MTLALLREIIGKYMTESYQIMPVLMREINGTYVTELYSNNASTFEGNES